MKKLLICLLLIGILCLSGCDLEEAYWQFEYGVEEITSIQIVNIWKYVYDEETGEDVPKYVVLKEMALSLAQEFCDDITQMKYDIPRSDDFSQYKPSKRCFIVRFNNGECDIFSESDFVRMRYDENHVLKITYAGLNHYEQENISFQDLLEKYYFD